MGGTDGAVDLHGLFNGLARASLLCLAGQGKRRKAPWVGPFNHNLMAWPCRHWLKGCCMARSEAAPVSGDGLPANRRSDLMRVFSVVLGETPGQGVGFWQELSFSSAGKHHISTSRSIGACRLPGMGFDAILPASGITLEEKILNPGKGPKRR